MTPDSELLRRYAESRSEEAFSELVRRHVNLVYSTVLRRLNGDTHLAEDAAQAVFTDLARKASELSRRASLTGWLYTTAHYAAAQIVRKEGRRHDREKRFMSEPNTPTAPDPDWERLRPALDDVMHELKEADREAILMRYFENRPLAEIGAKLGLGENTVRMRVERALDKLRAALAKRGMETSSSFLAAISANAIGVAPEAIAGSLVKTSLAAAGTETFTLLNIMTTNLKLGLGALAIVGATTTFVLQHQAQIKLRGENDSLRSQVAQLQTASENMSSRIATGNGSPSTGEGQLRELLRLRGEVGLLRDRTNELGKLREGNKGRQTGGSAEDEASSAEVQQKLVAESKMSDAKLMALGEIMYAQNNHGQFATNFDQLGAYLTNSPQTLTGTNNFELVYHGSVDALSNNAGSVLMMRESQSWPTLNGQWGRSYVFMDGHAEIHVEPSDDFAAFEQQHALPTDQPQ